MTRIERFKLEVLSQAPSACLPCNLPEEWLILLSRQADAMLEGDTAETGADEVMSALLRIKYHQNGNRPVLKIDAKRMLKCLTFYAFELSVEIVHRTSNVHYNAADLATIFTDRTLKVHAQPEP